MNDFIKDPKIHINQENIYVHLLITEQCKIKPR